MTLGNAVRGTHGADAGPHPLDSAVGFGGGMNAYAIADRFPIEARRYAAKAKYNNFPPLGRRTIQNMRFLCPLAMCLKQMGYLTYTQPAGRHVAGMLRAHGREWEAIEAEANEFVNDWDNGTITDLAGALGVQQ